jgi:Protein tyrosine kinase.
MSQVPPHPNLVRLIGVICDPTEPVLVLNYCECGTLKAFLKRNKAALPSAVKNAKARWSRAVRSVQARSLFAPEKARMKKVCVCSLATAPRRRHVVLGCAAPTPVNLAS